MHKKEFHSQIPKNRAHENCAVARKSAFEILAFIRAWTQSQQLTWDIYLDQLNLAQGHVEVEIFCCTLILQLEKTENKDFILITQIELKIRKNIAIYKV